MWISFSRSLTRIQDSVSSLWTSRWMLWPLQSRTSSSSDCPRCYLRWLSSNHLDDWQFPIPGAHDRLGADRSDGGQAHEAAGGQEAAREAASIQSCCAQVPVPALCEVRQSGKQSGSNNSDLFGFFIYVGIIADNIRIFCLPVVFLPNLLLHFLTKIRSSHNCFFMYSWESLKAELCITNST